MRRVNSSTPAMCPMAGLVETTPFTGLARRRQSTKVFSPPCFQDPGVRAEKLERAASSVESSAVVDVPYVSSTAFGKEIGSDGIEQSGQSGHLDDKGIVQEQQEICAGCETLADDVVSCFSKSALLLFGPDTNTSLRVSISPKKIASSFTAAACVSGNTEGSSDCTTPARQQSQAMAAAVTTLSRSGSSNGGTGPAIGKRSFEHRAAANEVGSPGNKIAYPRGRLRRVRRVIRDLDRLDEP